LSHLFVDISSQLSRLRLLQGDDYILYCHPHKQKTPRSDRLREWYLTLLRAAKERGIVAHISNLFDTFFEGGRDHRVPKPSVTHMPYLEGEEPLSCPTMPHERCPIPIPQRRTHKCRLCA